MINAEPIIWDRLIAAYPKVKKFRNKPFPLYNYLASLYEGSTASGDLNFTSLDMVDVATEHVIPTSIDAHNLSLNSSGPIEVDEVERGPSASSGHKEDSHGKKRKQNQIACVLESYLEFKREQTMKFAEELNETKKDCDEFSIGKCVAALESMKELTDLEKAKALRLFKCELNREIFLNTKNPSVRLLWIRSEITL